MPRPALGTDPPNTPVVPLRDLSPEAALSRLELSVGRRIDGLLSGDHPGFGLGPGSELAEARIYQRGQDDVRRIDWDVTARTGEVHVRDPGGRPGADHVGTGRRDGVDGLRHRADGEA